MSSSLQNLLDQLNLIENVVFDYQVKSDLFSSEIQKKLNQIQPDAIYLYNKQPFILFFDLSKENPVVDIELIHKKVWSFDNSPITFIIKNDEIQIFNALNYNKESKSLERLDLSEEERNKRFSFWELQSGNTWKWLQQDYFENNKKNQHRKRVNERLFQNIKDVRNQLIKQDGVNALTEKEANSLILRLIFIRYLIDRNIEINGDFISGKTLNEKRNSFCELIEKPSELNKLFIKLNENFNGVLFKETDIVITDLQGKYLANVFSGERQEQGTLFSGFYFEIFDFSIIPVEVISGIYESLINPETRNAQSAVYTPPFLVDYILEDTVQPFLNRNEVSECKIFEVAVGSGIFLVQSLRRMIDKEIELNGKENHQQFSERIREIAVKNLFGIDINSEALKVSCFSIYIALLDYQEPKEIDKYPFPKLLDENLFEANFFDEDLPYNNLIKNQKPDFVLGNPPWKSKKDDETHIDWLKKNNKTVGRYEIAQSFLLRSQDFMQEDTMAALIVTSTIFYNISKPTRAFKNEFMKTYLLKKFFDLSPVRRLIFEEKNSPASIAYFQLGKEEEIPENTVDHQSVKYNFFLKHFKTLVVEKFDQKKILQKHFIENDWMFKVALYGNTLDYFLIHKISNHPSLETLFRDDFIIRDGLKRDVLGKYNISDVDGLITEKRDVYDYFTPSKELRINNNEEASLVSLFGENRIILKGQTRNESDIVVSYAEGYAVYRNDTFLLCSTEEKVKLIYAYLVSNLYSYFQFITSSTWAIATRPAIRLKEYVEFPISLPKEKSEKVLISLVDQFLLPLIEYHQYKIKSESLPLDIKTLSKINEMIFESYDLSSIQKDLIDYALKVSRYQFQQSKLHLVTDFTYSNDAHYRNRELVLEKYASVFIEEFETIYEEEYIQVEIYPLKYFIAMNFSFNENQHKKKVIYSEETDERKVIEIIANNLSLSQIASTEDPTKNLFIQKDIKGFEQNSFYIIKPNEYKCWHRAMAWYDVAEFKSIIENAELKSLNS